jgi:dTDP-4-dehydrorhamnose reductase
VATAKNKKIDMKWLIIGGDGQLGLSFRDLLTELNVPFNFTTVKTLDITDQLAVSSYIHTCQPSVVVNCAAWTAVDAAEENKEAVFSVNCNGARNVARAARQVNAVHVFVSTDYVFPGNASQPYEVDDLTAPASVYGASKLCGEQAVIEEHPDRTYIVRTAWLYSKYGKNFVKTMVRKALAQEPVRVVNDQHGQPTNAGDLAQHVYDIVTNNAPVGIYHGTNSGETTWFGLTQLIFKTVVKDDQLVTPVPSTEYPTRAVRPSYSVLGHSHTIRNAITEMQTWDRALHSNLAEIQSAIREEQA